MNVVLRILAWLLAVGLVVLPVVAVLNGWVGAERWPLAKLRVSGDFKRVSAEELRAVVLPYVRSGFFAVRLPQVRMPLSVCHGWSVLMSVSVGQMCWKSVLWSISHSRVGGAVCCPSRGGCFQCRGAQESEVASAWGPDMKVRDVVALYKASSALFASTGLDVSWLQMDARGSWSLGLSNGLQIFVGRDDARARLERFARVLPQLLDPQRPVVRADLRYTNGFTVVRGQASVALGVEGRLSEAVFVSVLQRVTSSVQCGWQRFMAFQSVFPIYGFST